MGRGPPPLSAAQVGRRVAGLERSTGAPTWSQYRGSVSTDPILGTEQPHRSTGTEHQRAARGAPPRTSVDHWTPRSARLAATTKKRRSAAKDVAPRRHPLAADPRPSSRPVSRQEPHGISPAISCPLGNECPRVHKGRHRCERLSMTPSTPVEPAGRQDHHHARTAFHNKQKRVHRDDSSGSTNATPGFPRFSMIARKKPVQLGVRSATVRFVIERSMSRAAPNSDRSFRASSSATNHERRAQQQRRRRRIPLEHNWHGTDSFPRSRQEYWVSPQYVFHSDLRHHRFAAGSTATPRGTLHRSRRIYDQRLSHRLQRSSSISVDPRSPPPSLLAFTSPCQPLTTR